MTGVPARSVQQPVSAKDLFDQLDNVATLRGQLDALGLADPELVAAVDLVRARVARHLAETIKFDPGGKPRLVRNGDAFFAYDEADGQPSFDRVDPIDSADIPLGDVPAGGP